MRRAQNRRSQFPQRYCLMDTNRNNLSSKSWRRDRLIRLLLQFGHVITRKRLYSLIRIGPKSNLSLPPESPKAPSTFRTANGLIQTNLSSFSRKFRRCERAIIVLFTSRAGNDGHCSIFAHADSVVDVSQHLQQQRLPKTSLIEIRPGSSVCRQEAI